MNEFYIRLQENTVKQIDENIYIRIVQRLKNSSKTLTEAEKKHIDKRCSEFKTLFVNFEDYMYELERCKKLDQLCDKSETQETKIDDKISNIIEDELENMYQKAPTLQEKTQILNRMVSITSMLKDFDKDMEFIKSEQKKEKDRKKNKTIQEK